VIKKVEVLANIAVIVTSVILCSVLAKKYVLTANKQTVAAATGPSLSANAPAKSGLQAGMKVSLPGIEWSKSSRTVLLVVSTTCHFCTESAPFYQKLQQQKPANVQIVAVLPQAVEDGRQYLNKLGVSVSELVQAPLASLNVSGTPTLVLIDNTGVIQDSWAGKLSDGQAEKVLARIAESRWPHRR